ncbi:AfsR/SARP family transcriptional regulator [Streptomyces sp. MAR4 CNX-425]|uniref:AfsR/SARP family transcriptional regulator n=1 Tax=Streptomyces sp. MAR4 CNX-425 TaxID=3406343 RepID=UPI003B512E7A
MNVQIRILGAVTIDRGPDETVLISSAGARALLALLAWRPMTFVSDDVAVEKIWGETPPLHPRAALYTCANRLRRTIAVSTGMGTEVVARGRGAYRLVLDPANVDVHRFRQSLDAARTAMRQDENETALALFDRADALWHGSPVSDLSSAWACRTRNCLEQERLGMQLDRARVHLRLGRHAEILPLLHRLAEKRPLDESIAWMLILALHRSSRQSEALACFSRIRSQLIREIGDEPGPELKRLHQCILTRDPALSSGSPLVV